jgi:hypothetical protein
VVLGLVRTLWIAPLSGELVGILVEAPVMLAISWTACGWVTERLDVSDRFVDRLVMGGVALAVLVCAEAAIGMLAVGRPADEYFLRYGQSAVLLGLLAQLGFAVFPILRRRSGH